LNVLKETVSRPCVLYRIQSGKQQHPCDLNVFSYVKVSLYHEVSLNSINISMAGCLV